MRLTVRLIHCSDLASPREINMNFFLRVSTALILSFTVSSPALAVCEFEVLSRPLLLQCAEAGYGIDTTFESPPVLNYDLFVSGVAISASDASFDGFDLFGGVPPNSDIIPPYFADAELSFQGSASAATSVTQTHSGQVHITPGSTSYQDKDGKVVTLSSLRIDPSGVSDGRIQINSNFQLRDETAFSGPFGAPAFRLQASIKNQDGAVLYEFDGAAELELDTLPPEDVPPDCIGTVVVVCDDFVGASSSTPIGLNEESFSVSVNAAFTVSPTDSELFLDVRTLGAKFSSDFLVGEPFDPQGWKVSHNTTVSVSSDTPGGTFSLFELVPRSDLNSDGSVDVFDIALVAGNWGATGEPGLLAGDANKDGDVDIFDVALIAQNWSGASSAAVPEPSAASLLLVAMSAWAFVRRSRRASRNS